MNIEERISDIIYLAHFVKGKSIAHISTVSGVSKSFLYKVRKDIINSNKYYIHNR
jgi:hypothetical protein